MAMSSKKRKAAELDNEVEQSKLPNGHRSPSADGLGQETPPPIGLDATEVPFKLQCPAVPTKKKGKTTVKPDTFGPYPEDGGYPQLETTYSIRPGTKWSDLKPYRNFIVADNKFSLGSHVYISHPNSPKNPSDYKFVASDEKMEPDFWIAKVLEVRASDQQHVYLRVFWLYWPDELPGGRQVYHGQNEVVMSNHMDIIDAMTVSGAADVRVWHERDEDEELPSLFFRQFYNVSAKETLSELRRHCVCNKYYNPDTTLLKCNNTSCGIWLHEKCLLDDLVAKTYKQLVIDAGDDAAQAKDDNGPAKEESIAVETPKPSIFSPSGHLGDMLAHPIRAIKASMSPAPDSKTQPPLSDANAVMQSTPASEKTPAMPLSSTNGKSPLKPSRSAAKARPKAKTGPRSKSTASDVETDAKSGVDLKKAREAFAVKLDSADGAGEKDDGAAIPVKANIIDLRPGQDGKEWKESLRCLRCDTQLD